MSILDSLFGDKDSFLGDSLVGATYRLNKAERELNQYYREQDEFERRLNREMKDFERELERDDERRRRRRGY